ncbi:hypothetical protein B0H14DRAFT_2800695, partial [Mycena olivaceomarginata]
MQWRFLSVFPPTQSPKSTRTQDDGSATRGRGCPHRRPRPGPDAQRRQHKAPAPGVAHRKHKHKPHPRALPQPHVDAPCRIAPADAGRRQRWRRAGRHGVARGDRGGCRRGPNVRVPLARTDAESPARQRRPPRIRYRENELEGGPVHIVAGELLAAARHESPPRWLRGAYRRVCWGNARSGASRFVCPRLLFCPAFLLVFLLSFFLASVHHFSFRWRASCHRIDARTKIHVALRCIGALCSPHVIFAGTVGAS